MTLLRCPRCQVQVSVANNSGDFEHECNSGIAVLDQEDVPIIGQWSDYTGSDVSVRTSAADVLYAGAANKLLGTEAWVRDNAKTYPHTPRGANAITTRKRQHVEHIPDVNHVSQS